MSENQWSQMGDTSIQMEYMRENADERIDKRLSQGVPVNEELKGYPPLRTLDGVSTNILTLLVVYKKYLT